jgi:hypothetical protein
MATAHVLRDKRGNSIRLTISGKLVITGEGDDRIEQSFPSAADAAEHLERLIGIRRREGYAVAEVIELAGEVAADPLLGIVTLDAARGRMTVTFTEDKVPRGLCAQIVARVAADAPSTIQVICDPGSPGKEWAAAMTGKSLPSLTSFIFDTHFQTVSRQRSNAFGDLAVVLAALPAVERVFASGKLALSPTEHARLSDLHLLGDPLGRDVIEALGRSSFPALETLALDLCSDRSPVAERAAPAALQSMKAPRLAEVHVSSLNDVTGFLRALTSGPLPPSWSELSLVGVVRDEDELIALLKERADVLRTLSALGLPLGAIAEESVEEATALIPALVDEKELSELLLPVTYEDW